MTDLLERTTSTRRHEVGPSPPPHVPVIERPGPGPWPRPAKLLVAILAVATLVSTFGWIVAATGGDDTATDDQAAITELTAERDQLLAERADLLDERGELATTAALLDTQLTAAQVDVDRLTGELETLTGDLDMVTADRDTVLAERDAVLADLDAAELAVADLEAELDATADVTAALDQRIAALDGQVTDLLVRAFAAEQERDRLAALFPIELDPTVDDIALVDSWDVDWTEAWCDGFATCGHTPGFEVIEITETSQGWLRIEIDGVLDAGLFRIDGALYGITQSLTAAPACGAAQRMSYVSITLYPHGVTVADDGTHVVTDLAASMLIQAPASGSCPAAAAFYGAELTPG